MINTVTTSQRKPLKRPFIAYVYKAGDAGILYQPFATKWGARLPQQWFEQYPERHTNYHKPLYRINVKPKNWTASVGFPAWQPDFERGRLARIEFEKEYPELK